MKAIMVYFARCNSLVKSAMYDILSKNFLDPFDLKLQGYYFKKLSELLNHMFVADMIWMKAFTDIDACGKDLLGKLKSIPSYGDSVFTDYVEFLVSRKTLDAFIEAYMQFLPVDIFTKPLSRTTKSGERIEKIVYQAMIHFFNHQTHHRGQISNILDDLQVENNYSNLIYLDLPND